MQQYLLIPFLFLLLFSAQPGFSQEFQNVLTHSKEPSLASPDRLEKQEDSPHSYPFYDANATNIPDTSYDPLKDAALKDSDSFQSKFMNMVFLLALLIGFMLFASWMLKRMTKTRVTQLNQASTIKVLETRYLSPRSTLYLLDVQGQNLLIAESPMGVTHLSTLGNTLEPEEKESLPRTLPPFFSDYPKPKSN